MKYGILFLLFFYGLGKLSAQGNANAIVGVWLSENKRLKVEVYESNKKYFGKILWQYEKIDPETGQPKVDKENPDPAKRNRPNIINNQIITFSYFLLITLDFEFKDGFWQNGYVYNSQNGKTYSCEIWLEGKDVLVLRGYWGLVYHTEKWTRVKE